MSKTKRSATRKRSTAFWYRRMVWAMMTLKPLKLDEPTHVGTAVKGWPADGVTVLVEESRRELDDQKSSLDRILSRSQFLFSTNLALLAFYGTVASVIWLDKSTDWTALISRILLVASGGLLVLALVGSASVIAARKQFTGISAVVISSWKKYEPELLANEYTAALGTGDMTVNAHLSVYGSAVRLTLFAALLSGIAWTLAKGF